MAIAIGYVTTASTGFAAVRASAYSEPSSNAQRSLASSDAADASAGTGARVVRITYFDSSLSGVLTEDVTLSGTTPVNTVASDICFIESIVVISAGSQLANVGTVTLFAGTAGGGGAIGSVLPGDNQSQWCHHYVAASARAKLTGFSGHSRGPAGGTLHIRQTLPTIANTPETTIAPVIRLSPGVDAHIPFDRSPIIVVGPARIAAYVKPESPISNDWQAGFDYYEV